MQQSAQLPNCNGHRIKISLHYIFEWDEKTIRPRHMRVALVFAWSFNAQSTAAFFMFRLNEAENCRPKSHFRNEKKRKRNNGIDALHPRNTTILEQMRNTVCREMVLFVFLFCLFVACFCLFCFVVLFFVVVVVRHCHVLSYSGSNIKQMDMMFCSTTLAIATFFSFSMAFIECYRCAVCFVVARGM